MPERYQGYGPLEEPIEAVDLTNKRHGVIMGRVMSGEMHPADAGPAFQHEDVVMLAEPGEQLLDAGVQLQTIEDLPPLGLGMEN